MKKALLLIPALVAELFVSGNDMKCSPAISPAEEAVVSSSVSTNVVVKKAEDLNVINCVMADSTLQKKVVKILSADAPANYVNVSVYKPDTTKVVAVAAPDSVASDGTLPNKPFKSTITRWAGRDRYGKYTEECAAYVNGRLSRLGVYSSGHAYHIPAQFKQLVNGYSSLTLPNTAKLSYYESFHKILETHRKAADYVKANLDISKLDPNKYYVVNMYYSTSKYMVQFFNSARWAKTGTYATHVGIVYYDRKAEAWIVDHNIHGSVYRDALVSCLGGRSNPRKYGITSFWEVNRAIKVKK